MKGFQLTAFRRLIFILSGVVMAGVVAILLLLPSTIIHAGEAIARIDAPMRLLVVICVDLLILGAVVWRFWTVGDTGGDMLRVRAGGLVMDVGIDTARERIRRAVLSLPQVVEAEANVRVIAGRAGVELKVWLADECADFPAKQGEILRQVRLVITKQIGARFAHEPRLYIYVERDKSPSSARAASQIDQAVSSE